MTRIVHIGLSKAASTTLQKHVFPELAQSQAIEYLDPDTIYGLLSKKMLNKPIVGDNFLASSEMLVGPLSDWDSCLEKNLMLFGANTTILLILRRPSGYMRSIFQQVSHNTGLLIEPSAYFIPSDNNTAELAYAVFDANKFDQERLVKNYAEAFDEVIVQKFETISDIEFLRAAFDLSDQEIRAAQSSISKKSSNRSFSQTAVNISMKLKWMFGACARIKPGEKAKRTRRYKLWREFIQQIFDKIYPYNKFVLDWGQVPYVDVAAMDAAYDRMPDFQLFVNGIAKMPEK